MNNPNNRRFPWLEKAIREHNSDECLLWPFHTRNGYGLCMFQGRQECAHRISFYLTHGRWPHPFACHTCDTPGCVNPRHIVEGTPAQNAADMVSKNRQAKGENASKAKLTNELVKQIRHEYILRRFGYARLARKYGLAENTVKCIIKRRTWKHI